MKKVIYLFLGLSLFSCRLDEEGASEKRGPLHIVATTGIIEDCLNHIVGDSAEVSAIMGPGTDPHTYKPTPADIELLDEADIIVANGLHLEGKMAEMLDQYAEEKPVLIIADGIDEKEIIKSADFADAKDPHIWFDTKIWMDGLWHIARELGKLDTSSKDYYMDNFEAYQKEVDEVDQWAKAHLDSIDHSGKVLVTSHDAFSYFGRRYNLEVKGIQGISTLSEVGLKEIADMVDFVVEKKIKSIFIETSTSDKTARSIIDGCKAKKYSVELAGPLYSDALGEPDSDGGNYLGMLKANVMAIVEGLK
ncbi:MAG: zinc ABC transporter substrate-binding protein [Crocinitomicaceae bacterium]|nr:zinc ABC transporter substrate-binding protein [Crocinitomicaceae bacterium]